MSKNKFEIYGDKILISHPNWDFIASATIRDDYAEELQSVTWTKVGEYLYSNKLEKYLHIYIMRKWYGDDTYEEMKDNGYVVDHMDNNGQETSGACPRQKSQTDLLCFKSLYTVN